MSLVRAAVSGTMTVRFLNVSVNVQPDLDYNTMADYDRIAIAVCEKLKAHSFSPNSSFGISIDGFEYVTDEEQP